MSPAAAKPPSHCRIQQVLRLTNRHSCQGKQEIKPVWAPHRHATDTALLEPCKIEFGSKRKVPVLGQAQGKAGKPLPATPARPKSHPAVWHESTSASSSKWDAVGVQDGVKVLEMLRPLQKQLCQQLWASWMPRKSERAPTSNQPPTNHNIGTAQTPKPHDRTPEPARHKSNPAQRQDLALAIAAAPARCLLPGLALAIVMPCLGTHVSPQDLCCPCHHLLPATLSTFG